MEHELNPADALASAQAMRGRVAARIVYTPWYAPLYGLACGGLVASGGSPQPWGGIGTALSVLAVTLLYRHWQNSTGLSVNGYRKGRTRTIAVALAVVLVALILAGLALRTSYGIGWAPFACGAAAAIAATLASWAWDRAWRAQMNGPLA